MALRRFRGFIQDRQRRGSGRLEPNVLEEETDDQDITDAATVIWQRVVGKRTEAADGRSSN